MRRSKRIQLVFGIVATSALLFSAALPAQAQATRTWVSGVGDDANPCSRTAPCKTFAGTISKTAPGGEINVIDPGGFGALTITKSITIDGHPSEAGVLVAGTNGIVVAAGASDVVVLRGIDFEGLRGSGNANAGLSGIRFISGAALFVEDSTINGFNNNGIDFASNQSARLFVNNVTIQNVGGSGISVTTTSGTAQTTIDSSDIEGNNDGINASSASRVVIRNSVVAGNTGRGVLGGASTGTAEVNIEDTVISGQNIGIVAGANSTIRISNTMVTNNNTGLLAASGNIISYGNNRIHGNGPNDNQNGTPTQTIAQQ
ncbi:MAG TPA: right-handed parallel beta-helix repeat-containing protein [Chloroflexota bacterium]|jgi:hypothetical protein